MRLGGRSVAQHYDVQICSDMCSFGKAPLPPADQHYNNGFLDNLMAANTLCDLHACATDATYAPDGTVNK